MGRAVSSPAQILQVAYIPSLLAARAALLTERGYSVISVLGNDRALRWLRRRPSTVDLVLVGFSSTHTVRASLLTHLKQRHPQLPVLVLQTHSGEQFPEAACVAPSEDPERWLSAVADALAAR